CGGKAIPPTSRAAFGTNLDLPGRKGVPSEANPLGKGDRRSATDESRHPRRREALGCRSEARMLEYAGAVGPAGGRSRRLIERRPGPQGLPILRARRGMAAALFCLAFLASPRAYAACSFGPGSGGVIVDGATQTLGSVTAGYDNALVARNG